MPSSAPVPQQMPQEPVPMAHPEDAARRVSAEQPRPTEAMTTDVSMRGGDGDGGAICCGICAGLCCFECLECCC